MTQPDLLSPLARPVHWVRTSAELEGLIPRLRATRILAVDSESDSLHHFPEKVCLIQLAMGDGEAFLLDPLALEDLRPLAPILADPAVVKVFHGAAYDLAAMKRDFGFAVAGLFDTMVAAQFLEMPELGLSALLATLLGVPPGKSRQKDDWAGRPLSPAQEWYAAEDVRHLIALRAHLLDALRARGRLGWVAEECRALEATPAAERVFHPDDCFQMKGVASLDPQGLAVLRELFVAREAWAQERGRPPFRVMGNETLLRLAAERPQRREDLGKIPGCSPLVVNRYGDGLLDAVSRGLAIPVADLPVIRRPKKPRLDRSAERHIEALLSWRAEAAPRLGLDPGLLLPRRLIERLAQVAPPDLAALAAVDGIRGWRSTQLGDEILAAMAGPDRSSTRRAPGRTRQGKEEGGDSNDGSD
jgi:ribonuclease D